MDEKPDTSAAAVMHMVGMLPDWQPTGQPGLDAALVATAATLRALLAERVALEACAAGKGNA